MSEPPELPKRLLVAIGGNAFHPGDIEGTVDQQIDIAAHTGASLLPIMEMDNELVVTHGNGPVVGKILMRQVLARDEVVPMTLDICVAHSQGGIAYLLMQALENALREVGSQRHAVCLLTQVEVDADDPAFKNPTKPIGYFYSEDQAHDLEEMLGWTMIEDAGRGWRQVVPSPMPRHICDISLIDTVAKSGAVAIAGGGGGIPVIRGPKGDRHGIEAVIDKDLTSAHMANVLGIEVMMILTAVPRVVLDFGTPEARELGEVSLAEMRAYHAEGQFPAGSMGPKVEAAIRFLEGGGKRVIIGDLKQALPALLGETGTHVVVGDG